MKSFILGALLSTSVIAGPNFVCNNLYSHLDGWKHEVSIHGELNKKGKSTQLKAFVEYGIDCENNICWGQDKGEQVVINNPKYKPQKYRDHSQFVFDYSLSKNNESYGELELSMPNFIINLKSRYHKKRTTFMSYLIMSGVQDHHGTTVPLLCEIVTK